MTEPVIQFATSANSSVVSTRTLDLIRDILRRANCPSCTITSTARTAADQARVMYQNIVKCGVEKQKALYAAAGDAVIDEFTKTTNQGLAEAAIIKAMESKILALGPANVSRHCADPNVLNVIDIAPSSLKDTVAFEAELKKEVQTTRVSRYFSPSGNDPAFHIEVPQT